MRLPDDEFSLLYSFNQFNDYYESLTAAVMMEELNRLYADGLVTSTDYSLTVSRDLRMHAWHS